MGKRELLRETGRAREGSSGRAPDCQSRGRWFNSTYRRFETLAISFTPHLPVCFGRDTKSWWSLLSGVCARGSKISHTGGKCVTCSGLTNSRWTLNALQRYLREGKRRLNG